VKDDAYYVTIVQFLTPAKLERSLAGVNRIAYDHALTFDFMTARPVLQIIG
jgi:hypothetical protein